MLKSEKEPSKTPKPEQEEQPTHYNLSCFAMQTNSEKSYTSHCLWDLYVCHMSGGIYTEGLCVPCMGMSKGKDTGQRESEEKHVDFFFSLIQPSSLLLHYVWFVRSVYFLHILAKET